MLNKRTKGFFTQDGYVVSHTRIKELTVIRNLIVDVIIKGLADELTYIERTQLEAGEEFIVR